MPDYIESNIEIFKGIAEFYSTLHPEFDTIAKEICKTLINTITAKAETYDLVITNSVTNKALFKLEHRIKGKDNLLEKFIRKNEGLNFVKDCLLESVDTIKAKPNIVKNHLKLLDDVIGIKILTELKADCDNVYKLIQDNEPELRSKLISFYDLQNQPCKMKNGLSIYNIKGCFQNECNFELQIKSKIDSAWGDLDHTLFYKEYAVTPIRDTVQVSMNRIGMLLNELEGFLFDIRKSNTKYEDKAENLKYGEYFYRIIAAPIKDKFGFGFDISGIITHLKHVHTSLELDLTNLPPLDFKFVDYTSENEKHTSYTRIRNQDFKLIIIEAAYMSWQGKTISQDNYEEEVNKYLIILQGYLTYQIKSLNHTMDTDKITEYLNSSIPYLLKYSGSSKIFMAPELHSKHLHQINLFDGCFDWDNGDNTLKDKLLLATCLLRFGCDHVGYISEAELDDYDPTVARTFLECASEMKLIPEIDKRLAEDFELKISAVIKDWRSR